MSDPSIQQHIRLFPDFSLPSPHTVARYSKSFSQNFKFQLIHRVCLRHGILSVEMRLAMLALGARHLFEMKNASSLCDASKAIAMKEWLSSQRDPSGDGSGYVGDVRRRDRVLRLRSRRSTIQLAGTFLLLLEYAKLDLSRNLDREMHVLQSGLNLHLSLSLSWNAEFPEKRREPGTPVEAGEMTRRIKTYGVCNSAVHAFVLDSLPAYPRNAPTLRRPLPDDVWAQPASGKDGQSRRWYLTKKPNLDEWFSDLEEQEDDMESHDFDADILQYGYVVAGLLSHRLVMIRDGRLPESDQDEAQERI